MAACTHVFVLNIMAVGARGKCSWHTGSGEGENRKGLISMPSRTRLQVSTSSICILPPEVSRLSPQSTTAEEQPSKTFFMPGGGRQTFTL